MTCLSQWGGGGYYLLKLFLPAVTSLEDGKRGRVGTLRWDSIATNKRVNLSVNFKSKTDSVHKSSKIVKTKLTVTSTSIFQMPMWAAMEWVQQN
jgi:hypothetical protein